MDDWATSSPWAETTNDDDDFDDFQTSLPVTSTTDGKGATANGGEVALEGGTTNGFVPFKLGSRGSFSDGWGSDNHETSHEHHTDIHGGWKAEESVPETNGNGKGVPITHLDDGDKLKPGSGQWSYRNEWAKSQESLAPSETSNIWNKSDGWEKPEESPPDAKDRTEEGPTIENGDKAIDREEEEKPDMPTVVSVPAASIPVPDIKPNEIPIEEKPSSREPADRLDPGAQVLENQHPPPPQLEREVLSLTVPEPEVVRSASPVSPGDDFGDFEDEDTTAPIDAAPVVPIATVLPQFDIRTIDVDDFVIGNLGKLDKLYTTKSPRLSMPDTSEIIATTSQRKTWYKLIRKESARNSIQGEDVLRVRWTGSETQKKVHDIVKRWISEDRIGGRTILGRNASGAGMFDWNSTSPPSSHMSPTRSSFAPPKSRFEPKKRSSMGFTSPSSPRSPSFGWSSGQSPRNSSSGWPNGSIPTNSKGSITSPSLSSPQSLASSTGNSVFPPVLSPRHHSAPKHGPSSSVDIPRSKPTPSTSRPTSMFMEFGSKNLFGELSTAAIREPPPRAPVSSTPTQTHSTKPSMDLSIFDDPPPAKPAEAVADVSFDDDFGEFEGSEFQAAPPPPRVPSQQVQAASVNPAGVQTSQSGIATAGMSSLTPNIPISQPSTSAPILPALAPSEPPFRSSLDIATRLNQTDSSVSQGSKMTNNKKSTLAATQLSTDPWGSFDIFDAPKPVQPVKPVQQPVPHPAPRRLPVTPLGRPPLPQLSNKPKGKAQPKSPALPILSPPIIKQPPIDTNSSATADDDFDDWGEMVSTPTNDQKVEWPPSQAPKLSVSSEPPPTVRRRSWTLDMFGSPEENITSANPQDLLQNPKPTTVKRVPSPISVQRSNNMPTIPATPSPGATSLFSPVTLVPNRVSTPTIPASKPSSKESLNPMTKGSTVTRTDSFTSLKSLDPSSGLRDDAVANKRYSTPILPTQFTQPRPSASPQPSVASPLASEWGDMDFGAFEEATPKVIEAKAASAKVISVRGSNHKPAASIGSISTQPSIGQSKHASRGSVTMSPIVGKKDEDSVFNEIIDLLPDMGYMLK